MSPTQRTLAYLKGLGYDVEDCTVERWIPMRGHPGGGIRKDYLKIIDIVVIDEVNLKNIAIQSTGSAFSAHYKKIIGKGKEDEKTREKIRKNALKYMSVPCNELWLYGWRRVQKVRGGKLKVWKPRIHKFILEDFK